jgi:hypothetical protein
VEIGGSTGKRGVQTSSACVVEDCKVISVRDIEFSLFFVDRFLMDIYSTLRKAFNFNMWKYRRNIFGE